MDPFFALKAPEVTMDVRHRGRDHFALSHKSMFLLISNLHTSNLLYLDSSAQSTGYARNHIPLWPGTRSLVMHRIPIQAKAPTVTSRK